MVFIQNFEYLPWTLLKGSESVFNTFATKRA